MTILDRGGLEVLDSDTCLELLGTVPVGRIGFIYAGEVVVLPVNFVVDGTTVAFRTAVGSKLDAALRRARATFEADHFDPATRTGWSVLLKGTVDIVTDPDEAVRLDRTGLQPWADGVPRTHWVRLRPDEISGRRIHRPFGAGLGLG